MISFLGNLSGTYNLLQTCHYLLLIQETRGPKCSYGTSSRDLQAHPSQGNPFPPHVVFKHYSLPHMLLQCVCTVLISSELLTVKCKCKTPSCSSLLITGNTSRPQVYLISTDYTTDWHPCSLLSSLLSSTNCTNASASHGLARG